MADLWIRNFNAESPEYAIVLAEYLLLETNLIGYLESVNS